MVLPEKRLVYIHLIPLDFYVFKKVIQCIQNINPFKHLRTLVSMVDEY